MISCVRCVVWVMKQFNRKEFTGHGEIKSGELSSCFHVETEQSIGDLD